MLLDFVLISFAMFAAGLSGIVSSRHFIIMMLSIEIMISAAILLAVSFYYYAYAGNILLLLFALWSVASVEAIALVAIYRHFVKGRISLEVNKLSELKEV